MPFYTLTALFIILCVFPTYADAGSCRISGTVDCPETGELYILLCDKKSFSKPCEGVRSLKQAVSGPGLYSWEITGIPEGRYSLRAFLDTDGNGKLKRGLLGPAEPWAILNYPEDGRGIPEFQELSFFLEEDKTGINLILRD